MDPDVDLSYPNTAPMHDILQDALDDVSLLALLCVLYTHLQKLVSTRTSTASKGDALVAIEHVLAETADPRAVGLPGYFNALQDTFQCNGTSVLLVCPAYRLSSPQCRHESSLGHLLRLHC